MEFIALEGFISGYGIWVVIGVLGVAFIVSVLFLFLNIHKARKINAGLIPDEESISVNNDINKETEVKSAEKENKSDTTYTITHDEKTNEWVVKKIGAARATKRCKTPTEAQELVDRLSKK